MKQWIKRENTESGPAKQDAFCGSSYARSDA